MQESDEVIRILKKVSSEKMGILYLPNGIATMNRLLRRTLVRLVIHIIKARLVIR
jgi:hypothetical protein